MAICPGVDSHHIAKSAKIFYGCAAMVERLEIAGVHVRTSRDRDRGNRAVDALDVGSDVLARGTAHNRGFGRKARHD